MSQIEAKPTSLVAVLEDALRHRNALIAKYETRMDEYAALCDRWRDKYDAAIAERDAARAEVARLKEERK